MASPAKSDRKNDPRIGVAQQELFDENKSKVTKYSEFVVGRSGLLPLLGYEFVTMMSSWVPGALGFFLRGKLYPLLLGSCGRNVTFGQNVVLRHPHKIRIGSNVVVDDNCLLDAKGIDNRGIELDDGVWVGRNTILSCKNGNIRLEEKANVGFNCEIAAAGDVRIGKQVLLAAYVYIVAGDHLHERTDVPVAEQGRTAQGVTVEEGAWVGAHVVVADGVRIGKHAIIGAGGVVLEDVPDYHIAGGVPTRLLRDRREASADGPIG